MIVQISLGSVSFNVQIIGNLIKLEDDQTRKLFEEQARLNEAKPKPRTIVKIERPLEPSQIPNAVPVSSAHNNGDSSISQFSPKPTSRLPSAKPTTPGERAAIQNVVGAVAISNAGKVDVSRCCPLKLEWDWRRVLRQLTFLQVVLDIFEDDFVLPTVAPLPESLQRLMEYLPLPTSLPRLPYQIDPETAQLYHRSSKAKSAEHRAQLETVRFLYGNDTLTPDHVNCLIACRPALNSIESDFRFYLIRLSDIRRASFTVDGEMNRPDRRSLWDLINQRLTEKRQRVSFTERQASIAEVVSRCVDRVELRDQVSLATERQIAGQT